MHMLAPVTKGPFKMMYADAHAVTIEGGLIRRDSFVLTCSPRTEPVPREEDKDETSTDENTIRQGVRGSRHDIHRHR